MALFANRRFEPVVFAVRQLLFRHTMTSDVQRLVRDVEALCTLTFGFGKLLERDSAEMDEELSIKSKRIQKSIRVTFTTLYGERIFPHLNLNYKKTNEIIGKTTRYFSNRFFC